VYDNDPAVIGRSWDGVVVRDIARLEADAAADLPDIAVLAVPAEHAQAVVDRLVDAGIRAILNFAPTQLHVPPGVTLKSVNMAMELEGLSFLLTNRG
jgi:redox-sensing transcriptional repressor